MGNIKKFFKGDHPSEGINSPEDYLHLRLLKFYLTPVAMWPNWRDGVTNKKRAAVYFILFVYYYCFYINVKYIQENEMNFMDLGFTYLTLFMTILNLAKTHTLPLSVKYTEIVRKFHYDYNLFTCRNDSEYNTKVHNLVHKLSHFLAVYYITMTTFGPLLFNLSPIYDNYSRGMFKKVRPENETFASSMLYAFPFDYTTNLAGYIVVAIFNTTVTYMCSNSVIYSDLLVSLMVFQVWGHFKLLLNRLHTLPRPKSEKSLENDVSIGFPKAHYFDEEELRNMHKLLKDIIHQHRFVTGFIDEISEIFGPQMLVFYAFHQISGCLLLLEVSQMTSEAFLRFGLLTFAEFQLLIQVSIVFELINTESGKLKNAVYSVPWECMDIKCKKIVYILGMNVQEPVGLKALGLTQVGVTTMATILKTTFSYFAFLRSLN